MSRMYAANGDDPARMAAALMQAAGLAEGWDKNASIGLKPNLVVAKKWQSGATTNPAVCEAVIRYLLDRGFSDLFIIESSWLAVDTARAFEVCGYSALAKTYGIGLVDVKKDETEAREFGGLRVQISKTALAADHIINLPLIKGHCQTGMTCALKTRTGLIPDSEKRRFHAMGLSKPVACLAGMIRPSFSIADGTCADPGFEEGGNAQAMRTMIAGEDPVLIDAYAARMLGYEAGDVGYLRLAAKMGLGSADLEQADIVQVGEEAAVSAVQTPDALESAKARITQNQACSSCYGNLAAALVELEKTHGIRDLSVCVGQGFKGQSGEIGCGDCTSGFAEYVPGCPPEKDEIIAALLRIREMR